MVPPYIGHTLSKVWVICVLVSQVFVFFGVFSTELLPLPCKITEVGRLSLFIEFFVGFHIVCDRYTLDNAHFTYFNTIWPLSLSSGFGSEVYPWPENLSYSVGLLESFILQGNPWSFGANVVWRTWMCLSSSGSPLSTILRPPNQQVSLGLVNAATPSGADFTRSVLFALANSNRKLSSAS